MRSALKNCENSLNLMTSPKIYLGFIFWIFVKKIQSGICNVDFFTTRCYIFYMFSFQIMDISVVILVVSRSRNFSLGKTYIHFFSNTFPIDTVIINLANYIWGI